MDRARRAPSDVGVRLHGRRARVRPGRRRAHAQGRLGTHAARPRRSRRVFQRRARRAHARARRAAGAPAGDSQRLGRGRLPRRSVTAGAGGRRTRARLLRNDRALARRRRAARDPRRLPARAGAAHRTGRRRAPSGARTHGHRAPVAARGAGRRGDARARPAAALPRGRPHARRRPGQALRVHRAGPAHPRLPLARPRPLRAVRHVLSRRRARGDACCAIARWRRRPARRPRRAFLAPQSWQARADALAQAIDAIER